MNTKHMYRKEFFVFSFVVGLFAIALPASAEHLNLPLQHIIQNISVTTSGHTATFRWFTPVASDSWVDMQLPTYTRYVPGPNNTYIVNPHSIERDGEFYHWRHAQTNEMIGRCDGGGEVQSHCAQLVTPFQNTVYPYRIKSCAPDGHGNIYCVRSQVGSFTSTRDTQAPSAPRELKLLTQRGTGSLWLEWQNATDDELRYYVGYRLYRNGAVVYTIPPGQYTPPTIPVPSGTATTLYDLSLRNVDPAVPMDNANRRSERIDTGLTQGTTYQYHVTAFDIAGNESVPSNVISATTLMGFVPTPPEKTPPSKPGSITTGAAATCCTVNLSWEASEDTVGTNLGVTGYNIYRNDTLLTTATGTNYSDINLSPSTTYSYYVRAVDGDGNLSDPSPTGRATTPARPVEPTMPPTAPTNVAATAFTDATLVVWADRANSERSYAIHRREVGDTDWTVLSNAIAADSTAYRDAGAPTAGEFEYKVEACNSAGCTPAASFATAVHVSSRAPETLPVGITTRAPATDTSTTTARETTTTTTAPVRTIERVTTGPSFDKTLARESSVTINDDKALAAPVASATCESNSLIKNRSSATVYYCGADGKRHVFMNDRVYFSWYEDFKTVRTVSDSELAAVSLGSVITYRPGVKMVKIESDPKVYAIGTGGLLRHVSSEAIAISLYGTDWAKQVDDIPVSLFTKFTLGPAITE